MEKRCFSKTPFAITLLVLVSAVFTAAPAETYSSWSDSAKVSFNTTTTGAGTNAAVDNFPVLVRLTPEERRIFRQAAYKGRDLRFADPDGSALPFEIERWDSAASQAEIWVLVPRIDGNSLTDYITMFWGNSSASQASNGSAVFGTANGFNGVWHLNENSTLTHGVKDQTSNGNTGIAKNMEPEDLVTGIAGQGVRFEGDETNHEYIEVPQSPSIQLSDTFTVSVWCKPESLVSRWVTVVGKQLDSAHRDQFFVGFEGLPANTPWMGAGISGVSSSQPISLNEWVYSVAVSKGSTRALFINGVLAGTVTVFDTGSFVSQSPMTIGAGYNGLPYPNEWFQGTVDEVIVSAKARSSNWIKLCFENQRSQSTFSQITFSTPFITQAQLFTSPESVQLSMGGELSYTLSYDVAAVFGKPLINVVKKPSWVTWLGNMLIGIAPDSVANYDVLVTIEVEGIRDTLNLLLKVGSVSGISGALAPRTVSASWFESTRSGIVFTIDSKRAEDVEMIAYEISGRPLWRHRFLKGPGRVQMLWRGKLAAGTYLLAAKTAREQFVRKMVLF